MQARSTVKTEEGHIHRWILQRDNSSKCIASYNGRACIKILVTPEELNRRNDAWAEHCEASKLTESKRDYDEMKVAFKYKDKQKMKEILAVVSKRCKPNPEYKGFMDEQMYLFNEEEYMPTPNFPDLMHPKSYYITT